MRCVALLLFVAVTGALAAGCTEPAQLPAPPAPPGPGSPAVAQAANLTVDTSLVVSQAGTAIGYGSFTPENCRILGLKDATVVAANLTGQWTPGNPTAERVRFMLFEDRSSGRRVDVLVGPGESASFAMATPLRGPVGISAWIESGQAAAATFEQEVEVHVGLQAIGGQGVSVQPC